MKSGVAVVFLLFHSSPHYKDKYSFSSYRYMNVANGQKILESDLSCEFTSTVISNVGTEGKTGWDDEEIDASGPVKLAGTASLSVSLYIAQPMAVGITMM